VTGVRQDAYIKANPIIPEVEKGPGQLVNKGEYLYPDGYTSTSVLARIAAFFGSLFGR
jgi:hypothetical protein